MIDSENIENTEKSLSKISESDESNYNDENNNKIGIIDKLSFIYSKAFNALIEFNDSYSKSTRQQLIILPKTFLDCLNHFKVFSQKYFSKVQNQIQKYKVGVKKIDSAEQTIKEMSEHIETQKPLLEEKSAYLDITFKEIDIQKTEAIKFREQCEIKEKEAIEKSKEAEEMKRIADNNIAEAEEMKLKIENKIKTIDASQCSTLKKYRIPPKQIATMMQAITAVMNNFEKKPLEILPLDWEYYKKVLVDIKFLEKLKSFPQKLEVFQFTDKTIKLLEPYIQDQSLLPTEMIKVSSACEIFCIYFRSMYELDNILKTKLIPSKLASDKATESYNEAEAELQLQKENLRKIEEKIDELEVTYDVRFKEKLNLVKEIEDSKLKLHRAERLSSNLKNEKERWREIYQQLERSKGDLLGNAVICSFYFSFLTPYLDYYRVNFLKNQLIQIMNDSDVMANENHSLSKIIGNPFKIQDWIANGLPSDEGNINNAIVLFESPKPVLLLDPQKQGVKFLTKLFYHSIVTYKKIDDNGYIVIEKSIKDGKTLIFDYINDDISPELDSLISSELVTLSTSQKNNPKYNIQYASLPYY